MKSGNDDYPSPHVQVKDKESEAFLSSPPAYNTLYSVINIKEILNSFEREGPDDNFIIPLTLVTNSNYVKVNIANNEEVHHV